MVDTKNREITEFHAEGADRVAGAFGMVGSAAGGLVGQLGKLAAIAGPIATVLATLGGALTAQKILAAGSAYENVEARMAGTLGALGFADNFDKSLQLADREMEKIYATAAKLPGEAEDYIEVFTQSLPVLQQSMPTKGLDDFVDFSNKFTAVAKSLQISTGEAAGDLVRMLSAGRGMIDHRSPAMRAMLPFMMQVKGFANLTTMSFNQLSQTARHDLIGKAMAKLDPMVEHMASSWDAVKGAVATAERTLLRMSTGPAFTSIKTSMQKVADLILDANGKLTDFGRIVSTAGQMITGHIGKTLDRMSEKAKQFGDNLGNAIRGAFDAPWVRRMDQLLNKVTGFKAASGFGGPASGRNQAYGAVAGAVGMGAAVNILPGGFLVKMLLGPLATAFGAAAGPAIGGVFERFNVGGLIDGFVAGLGKLVDPLEQLGAAVASIFTTFTSLNGGSEGLITTLGIFGDGLLNLTLSIIKFSEEFMKGAGPIIGGLLFGLEMVVLGVTTLLTKLFNFLAKLVHEIVEQFKMIVGKGEFVEHKPLGYEQQKAMAEYERSRKLENLAPGSKTLFSDFLKQLVERSAAAKKEAETADKVKPKTPPNRPPGNTIQDFRGSRFTIQQDFDKNFDPDRIAVAFAKDVGKIGEKRLQSGFEPLFGVS